MPRDVVPVPVLDYLIEAAEIQGWPTADPTLLDTLVTLNGRTKRFADLTRTDVQSLALVIASGDFVTTGGCG